MLCKRHYRIVLWPPEVQATPELDLSVGRKFRTSARAPGIQFAHCAFEYPINWGPCPYRNLGRGPTPSTRYIGVSDRLWSVVPQRIPIWVLGDDRGLFVDQCVFLNSKIDRRNCQASVEDALESHYGMHLWKNLCYRIFGCYTPSLTLIISQIDLQLFEGIYYTFKSFHCAVSVPLISTYWKNPTG